MTEPSRSLALSRLMVSIHAATEAGEQVPCLNRDRGHLWLSDDVADQEVASLGCSTCCPALTACARYVEQYPEPAGVWAGRIQTETRGKK